MAVDVLTYNELVKDVNNLRDVCVPAANATYSALGTANGSANGTASSFISSPLKSQCYGPRLSCSLHACPWDCTLWSKVPSLNSVTSGFAVCDATYTHCGVCCVFTVPAGATFIRFQLWGAGGASFGPMCCGLGMPAGTGAYASVIIPAVPGCVYTICAGCALCCYLYCSGSSYTQGSGCQSFVTGYGLCNFCADGGESNPYNMIQRYTACEPTGSGVCVISSAETMRTVGFKGTYYGFCMCSNGSFCNAGNCYMGFMIPYTTTCKTYYGIVTTPTNSCHYVTGIPGMISCMCGNGCQVIYFGHPPVFGCCSAQGCSYAAGPGQLTNAQACAFGVVCAFGAGALASSAAAGTFYCGGMGAGGAVCVQYTTTC